MLLYYITDRLQFSGNGQEKKAQLLRKIAECAGAGVQYVQLREKDLTIRDLQELGAKAAGVIPRNSGTRLLINSRIDVALACGAAGVHLPADDLPASEARVILARAGEISPVVASSCHTAEEVAYAEAHGADLAVFGPVFEKNGQPNLKGLEQLHRACNRPNTATHAMPMLALGGITLENARQCQEAGAEGIAAIRLFQQNDVEQIAKTLMQNFG